MSLSGWRPTVVTGLGQRKPRAGVRAPGDDQQAGARRDVVEVEGDLVVARLGRHSMLNVIVVRSPGSCSSGAPHDEQKFAPSALRCPHWLQKTSAIVGHSSALDERAVRVGVEQLLELRRRRRAR